MDIREISFHVFFDEGNVAYFSAAEAYTNILKVTLTGNKYQLQGFICFFFARYGSGGLGSDELQEKEMLQYHLGHFYEDDYVTITKDRNIRYIIDFTHGSHQWDSLHLCTSHLEYFISGMETVPSQIELLNSDDSSIIIKPIYSGTDWKKTYRYLDTKDPQQYALYMNEHYDNPIIFENAPVLATVNTQGITPVTFTITKCTDYIMPTATLGPYLASCRTGKPRNIPVNTLEVVYSSDRWKDIHSIALAQICHRLKVRKLYFLPYEAEDVFFERLAKCANSKDYPFLSELRETEIVYAGNVPRFWQLINNSNVRSLTCQLPSGKMANNGWISGSTEIVSYADQILEDMYDNDIYYNYKVQELRFVVSWSETPVPYESLGNPNKCTGKGITVLGDLLRNRKGFRKCVDATIVLLGLRRRRCLSINRDVLCLVISDLWGTRGTVGWTD